MEESNSTQGLFEGGLHIDKFEDLYQTSIDPWNQSAGFTQEDSRRVLTLEHCRRLRNQDARVSKTLEVGCGFGYLTQRLFAMGFDAVGIDVAPSAVRRAKELHPGPTFFCRAFEDHQILDDLEPQIVILSEITWFVLAHLSEFRRRLIDYASAQESPIYLIHLLTTYPSGVQKVGLDFFTDLEGILRWWSLSYIESGFIESLNTRGTYFVAEVVAGPN